MPGLELTQAPASSTSSSVGEGSSLWAYGHSYLLATGSKCTAGQEVHNRLKLRRDMAGVTTYGTSGYRMAETATALVASGTGTSQATVPAGAKWDGTRRGIIVLDSMTNDMLNPTAVAGTTAGALSSGGVNNFTNALRACLAVLSASAHYEEPGSATNWSANAGNGYSGAANLLTQTQNAFVDVSVTVPASGILYALSYLFATGNGDATYKVGATTYKTWTGTGEAQSTWYSVASGGTLNPNSATPCVQKITGLPTGAQTIRVTKTDAGSGYVFVDAFFAPAASPPPIIVLKDPIFDTAKAPSGANTTGNASTIAANKALLDPVIDSVCAEFTNAIAVDPGLVAADLGSDGIHPNDRGMRKLADAVERALVNYWHDFDNAYTTV